MTQWCTRQRYSDNSGAQRLHGGVTSGRGDNRGVIVVTETAHSGLSVFGGGRKNVLELKEIWFKQICAMPEIHN